MATLGKVAEDLIGPRAKSIFLLLILFLICLVMGVFVRVVAGPVAAVHASPPSFSTVSPSLSLFRNSEMSEDRLSTFSCEARPVDMFVTCIAGDAVSELSLKSVCPAYSTR